MTVLGGSILGRRIRFSWSQGRDIDRRDSGKEVVGPPSAFSRDKRASKIGLEFCLGVGWNLDPVQEKVGGAFNQKAKVVTPPSGLCLTPFPEVSPNGLPTNVGLSCNKGVRM